MTSWHPRILETSRSKYLGIVEALEQDILEGRVKPGTLLPSQRAIARDLSVDLTTVTRAFAEARQRGLIRARAGRGTFALWPADAPQELPQRTNTYIKRKVTLDLGMNNPPVGRTHAFAETLRRDLDRLLAEEPSVLDYPTEVGRDLDMQAGVNWLKQRIDGVQRDRTLVAAGAQAALFGIFHLLCRPDDHVCVPSLVYPGTRAIIRDLNLEAVALEQDEEGILPDAFAQACRRGDRGAHPIKALYLTPDIDNPTTATLTEPRRTAIARIAQTHGVAIIEDAPYSALRANGFRAFASLVPELTWHVATVSKVLSPALRMAYVLTPSAADAHRLAGVFRATHLNPPPISVALVRRWLSNGSAEMICRDVAQENTARQRIARAALKSGSTGTEFFSDLVGPHGWLQLPAGWNSDAFADEARRAGVIVAPDSAFAVGESRRDAVRLSFGTPRDHASLKAALDVLSILLSQPTSEIRAVV